MLISRLRGRVVAVGGLDAVDECAERIAEHRQLIGAIESIGQRGNEQLFGRRLGRAANAPLFEELFEFRNLLFIACHRVSIVLLVEAAVDVGQVPAGERFCGIIHG